MRPSPVLKLEWIAGRFAVWRANLGDHDAGRVARLICDDGAVVSGPSGALASVTRTPDELSIVCDESMVPEGAAAERGFAALRVAGTLDMGMVGILRSIADPLADAGIALFVVSTFDTDYVLVRASHGGAATAALRAAGHTIDSSGPIPDS